MRVEDGYEKDGWNITVLLGKSVYVGGLDEQGGMLTGTTVNSNGK